MKVKVVVLTEDSIYKLPIKAKDMIEFWKERLTHVPEEYQDIAKWDIELSTYYDSPSFTATLYYYREEFEEERNYREQAELRKAERLKQREIAEFKRLKAKLGE